MQKSLSSLFNCPQALHLFIYYHSSWFCSISSSISFENAVTSRSHLKFCCGVISPVVIPSSLYFFVKNPSIKLSISQISIIYYHSVTRAKRAPLRSIIIVFFMFIVIPLSSTTFCILCIGLCLRFVLCLCSRVCSMGIWVSFSFSLLNFNTFCIFNTF